MGNGRSRAGKSSCSRLLPKEQAEVDRLFDALSAAEDGAQASPCFSLMALKARSSPMLGSRWGGDPMNRFSVRQGGAWLWLRGPRGPAAVTLPLRPVMSARPHLKSAPSPICARERSLG